MHGLPGKCANLTPEWGVTQVSDSRSASPREGGTSIVWADTAVSASYGDVSFRDLFNPAEGDSRQRLHCTDHIKRPGQLHKLECRRRLARGRNREQQLGEHGQRGQYCPPDNLEPDVHARIAPNAHTSPRRMRRLAKLLVVR